MNDALIIKDRLDELYSQVLNGKQDIFSESDKIMLDILRLKDLVIDDQDESDFVEGLIHSFVENLKMQETVKEKIITFLLPSLIGFSILFLITSNNT